jgi:uncharacterized membrane protein
MNMEPVVSSSAEEDHKTRQVELLISNILRFGVVISLMIVVLGMTVTFIHHEDYLTSPQDLKRLTGTSAEFPHSARSVIDGLLHFQGRAIVVLGLLLLILTPVLRVAASIVGFVYEKDFIFVVITSMVLALLILSFFVGAAEG